ncbi:MAG: UbiD family decarboxylase, partial [Alphaproteobacteria bacterium]
MNDKQHDSTVPSVSEALGDLRAFIRKAEAEGELEVIRDADPQLEVGALYEMSLEHLYPPVLLFEQLKGCDPAFRVICNVRTTRFLVGDLDIAALRKFRSQPKEKKTPIPPRLVNTGPLMENVFLGDDVDVTKLPPLLWHAGDGGNYIGTECCVITRDPDNSDWVNIGTYRVMTHDRNTLTVFIEPGKQGDAIRRKYWARGESCPMAVSVGQAPILGTVGATAVPAGVSEYAVAGARIGRPLDVVAGQVTGLPLPADAEIVFEGHMPPPERETRPEGPFGEWPGYYASDEPQPVLKVEALYHRDDAIIVGAPPTKPIYPGRQVKIPNLAAIWDALEGAGVPGVKGVWNLLGGGYRFILVVSISQMHAGHAKMAGLCTAGCNAAYMARLVVVVDDDIDITNPAEVMWALATRWDPKTQTDIIDDCWTGYIDPSLTPEKREGGNVAMSRMIAYAVRPWHWKDDFPKVNAVDPDYAREVREKWSA